MKKLIAVLIVLGLWICYSLGYRKGTQDEEHAWKATMRGRDTTDRTEFVYRDPHARVILSRSSMLNTVDPRVIEQYRRGSIIVVRDTTDE